MKSAADGDEVPYETIASESESEEAAHAFAQAESDFRELQSAALNLQSANLKDQLLRSQLFKQPEGSDRADGIIVDEIMTAADAESRKAALSAVVDDIEYSPITVTTDSSSDLE